MGSMKQESQIREELAEQKEHRSDITNGQALTDEEKRSLEMANERILMLRWVLEDTTEDDQTVSP